jgi:hypothetical protein
MAQRHHRQKGAHGMAHARHIKKAGADGLGRGGRHAAWRVEKENWQHGGGQTPAVALA